jgi:UDP-glucose 4-epimerase
LKVLVTGAAGFLGRWFTADHIRRGDQVYGVDDFSNPFSHWPDELSPARRYNMDVLRFFGEGRVMNQFDRAYHFAAPVGGREKIEGDPLFNAGSLALDTAFFRWAVENTRVAVYPSSSAVYPVTLQRQESHLALMESEFLPEQYEWGKPDEVYGLAKLVGEYLAWKSVAYGLKTLCIRPFSGYGEDQGLDYPIPALARKVAMGEDPIVIWGSALQSRDFVHVSDIVGATQARLDESLGRGYAVMNIGSGVPTTFRSVVTKLLVLANRTATIKAAPEKPEGVRHRYADNGNMRSYYEPQVPLAEGLARVLLAQQSA